MFGCETMYGRSADGADMHFSDVRKSKGLNQDSMLSVACVDGGPLKVEGAG